MSHEKVASILNKQIANWSVLFVKLHNYHWFVKGPQFFTLHEKFEELYNEAATHIDELAERLLALRGQPAATMREYLEISSVTEARGEETADEMVAEISKDFDTLIDELKEGMEAADSLGDETTADMLLAIHQSLEKHNWMLRSFLK
ncbi:DNA starvation/stationary phase protection protein [Halalkalibacterium halodurans]|jgi:starvation-inducible DNA-binding protein|uniref:Stress-and starvation-induced gene controlled by sigma-B n=2 Tax=Halalkalibacterium halodurans TaxID=86665 RepID=Q9KE40_HALH5|nr:Dps family protein [Halalkalibacterium halodurans]MDY7221555.1 Dps family protein [Halalkalibacterium halodurans]MDY7240831.1 Dps family protein [Halalkalibacterium halodurans]MED3648245.1 DNA starvation/stationary phase protection protein [Halalkalibacterium halodurans]MED4080486.1 DNA starvation/stationary phase protection protein [Halalkalibacterium halodurans]MED4086501.1 DNA starvation/stationary phase protection protein [Halalkalibacterium halodurans]